MKTFRARLMFPSGRQAENNMELIKEMFKSFVAYGKSELLVQFDTPDTEELRNEVDKLREELKLSEARRGEMGLAIQLDHERSLNQGWGSNWLPHSLAALASQPRPKILDVLEAAKEIEHDPNCSYHEHSDCDCDLGAALAAMEKE